MCTFRSLRLSTPPGRRPPTRCGGGRSRRRRRRCRPVEPGPRRLRGGGARDLNLHGPVASAEAWQGRGMRPLAGPKSGNLRRLMQARTAAAALGGGGGRVHSTSRGCPRARSGNSGGGVEHARRGAALVLQVARAVAGGGRAREARQPAGRVPLPPAGAAPGQGRQVAAHRIDKGQGDGKAGRVAGKVDRPPEAQGHARRRGGRGHARLAQLGQKAREQVQELSHGRDRVPAPNGQAQGRPAPAARSAPPPSRRTMRMRRGPRCLWTA